MKQVPMATPSISIKVVPTSRGNTVESKWGHTFSVGENANQITNEIGIAIVIATTTDPIVHASILFRLRPRNGNKLLYLNAVIIRSSKGSLTAARKNHLTKDYLVWRNLSVKVNNIHNLCCF